MNKVAKFFAKKAYSYFGSSKPFHGFLASFSSTTIVGYAKRKDCCPIAEFAKSKGFPIKEVTWRHLDIAIGNHDFTVVGVNRYGYTDDGILDTGDAIWYSDFIQIIDRLYETETPITAERALSILNIISDEENCI